MEKRLFGREVKHGWKTAYTFRFVGGNVYGNGVETQLKQSCWAIVADTLTCCVGVWQVAEFRHRWSSVGRQLFSNTLGYGRLLSSDTVGAVMQGNCFQTHLVKTP